MTAATAPEPMGRRSVPSRAAAAATADVPSTPRLVTIGEVLAQLREEFPDVTISKLRFLEAEGLVEPRRTPAGYRKYSAADIARLRYVLAAQRDRFLPLRVIREQLGAMDRGVAQPSTGAHASGGAAQPSSDAERTAPAPRQDVDTRVAGVSMTQADAAVAEASAASISATSISAASIAEASAASIAEAGSRARFSRDDVLARSGLTDEM